ncbi:M56 family metallopeptidase [Inhella gelatinilytica]|uniref:M56 family metallopeptidase n=1 Tax=Inhella gelatinilytica TaxID=2795030 RepID=A0A931IVB2_9BURK|nr:M56 family metallopeptidase [Inhella gelatinilytica]MBH9553447.1 M56 family metallopeptidase [Inhella gelatinilytica]
MSEAHLLKLLGQQTVLLSLAVLTLLLLRPLLRRWGGAGAVLAGWSAVPAVLLSPWLPPLGNGSEPLAWRVRTEALLAAPLQALPAPATPGVAWGTLLLTAWLAGLGGLALALAWQQRRYLRQGPRLPAGSSPAWVGLWRGRLWLPLDYRQRFAPEERRLIRAHERAHAQRGDNAWTLLATAVWLLHWFNPLAWWALRRLRADQELAADAQVLRRHPSQLATYLRTLAKAEAGDAPRLAMSPFAPHPLLERIRWMKTAHAARIARPWVALFTGLLMLGTAWALRPAPPVATEPNATATAPRYWVAIRVGERTVDHKTLTLDDSGSASVRLSSFGNEDLLLTLKGGPLEAKGQRLQAHVQAGALTVSMTEGEAVVREGHPLQLAIHNPENHAQHAMVQIGRVVERPMPALDPDQSGEVVVDIQAFVDQKAWGSATLQSAMGQAIPLALAESSGLPIRGTLQVQARLPAELDLGFALQVGERTLKPRVLTRSGVKATIEFNSPEDPRIVRIEVTPRRLRP